MALEKEAMTSVASGDVERVHGSLLSRYSRSCQGGEADFCERETEAKSVF